MPKTIHGHTWNRHMSPTYRSWIGMKQRCINHQNTNYTIYGARGISVCKRWMNFENFLADMGDRPDGKSIDRINNNGNYEPSNCRWATNKEQQRNRRNNHIIKINGKDKCIAEHAEMMGMPTGRLRCRISNGWNISELNKIKNSNSDKFYKRKQIKRNELQVELSTSIMNEFKKSVTKIKIYLGVLDDREREIIKMRFGLKNGKKATLQEVADNYKLSRERIRQIEDKAIKKILEAENSIHMQ